MVAEHDRMPFPRATTSYERPAPWPHTMHKCAGDPALPRAPHRRPVSTHVQRWDPTLPCALGVSSWGHTCAATGAHAVRLAREQGAPMERVARQTVSHGAQSPDERLPREKGRQAPFLLAGVQGQRPAGGAGGNAPAGVQGQRTAAPDGAKPPPRTPHIPPSHIPAFLAIASIALRVQPAPACLACSRSCSAASTRSALILSSARARAAGSFASSRKYRSLR
jgi:hypothetical protein